MSVLCTGYLLSLCFFLNDTATTEIYTLSLHDALPIWPNDHAEAEVAASRGSSASSARRTTARSEEHTSELQSRQYLVCRLLLETERTWIADFHTLGPSRNTFIQVLTTSAKGASHRLSEHVFFLMIRRPPRSTLFPYDALPI